MKVALTGATGFIASHILTERVTAAERSPAHWPRPEDGNGNLIMLGTGALHWSTVHVADLERFFRRVLEDSSARAYYVVGDGLNPTVGTFAAKAQDGLGWSPIHPGLVEEFRTGSYRVATG